MTNDRLPDDLRALGRELDVRPLDEEALVTRVVSRLPAQVPSARTAGVLRRRPSVVIAIGIAVLLALALTPPVRAVVTSWLEYGGVLVRTGPVSESPTQPPSDQPGLTLAEGRELVEFTPVVPERLGAPRRVEVSADRRLLSMTWGSGENTVRLDQFDGRLDPMFIKTVARDDPAAYVGLANSTGLWLSSPHALVLLDADGTERTESARTAGPTLVWQVGAVTLRLEGPGKREAIAIANSASSGTR